MPQKPNAKKIDAKTLSVCRAWQKKLNLVDWDIDFVYAAQDDLGINTVGDVCCNVQHRRAEIRLLPQCKRDEDTQVIEQTIVHELLHVLLSPFCNALEVGSVGQYVEEQAINSLAKALTGLSWRKDPNKV